VLKGIVRGKAFERRWSIFREWECRKQNTENRIAEYFAGRLGAHYNCAATLEPFLISICTEDLNQLSVPSSSVQLSDTGHCHMGI
jgi:hypothetical protein